MAKKQKVKVGDQEIEEEFDSKWLKDVMVTDHVEKPVVKNGKTTKETTKVAEAREATEADVLDWSDKGDTVVIVTKDGRKLSVKK
jgi:hypothetical protein